ncbi:MAG: recombinase zinc beta ribbon domain-containing protein [Candidatus Wallbacteria bacterium]|nr:recombinase zinc beta ribbon domain-containing protein [Candidatus Wallbacteria bacterium]
MSDEHVFLLEGILSCGRCGRAMRPRRAAGEDGDAYGCSSAPEGFEEGCNGGLLPAAEVEASVLEMLRIGALSRRRVVERELPAAAAAEDETRAVGLALAAARANHRRLEAALEADNPAEAHERHGRKELLQRLACEMRLLEDCLQFRAPLGAGPWLEVELLRRFCEVFGLLEVLQQHYALRLLLRRVELGRDALELELKGDLRPLAWFLNRSLPPRAAPSFEEPAGRALEPRVRPATVGLRR